MIISIKSEEDIDVAHMLYWVLIESGIGMLVGILLSYGAYRIKKILGLPDNHPGGSASGGNKKYNNGDIEMGTMKKTAEIGIMTEEPDEHKDPLMRDTLVTVNLV